jgi:two-component system CheB/CheR fusion protein
MPSATQEAFPHADAQAMLAAIVESSDDAIVSKSLEGIITSWNKGAEQIFGYTAEEMIGMPLTVLIPPERQDEEPRILARIRAGERVDHFETVRVAKDGRRLEISVTISPMRDTNGRIIGASKIARDITQQKQIQRDLIEAKNLAESASRAKDHFLSVLSHELRTPLTPVLAAISHIESDPNLPREFLDRQIGMIRRNIETEARLVDDLLDLTRIARGKIQLNYEATDAQTLLQNAMAMVQADSLEKSIEVTTDFRANDVHVWADAGRIQQVFLNLLCNAVKFTPDGGRIVVRTENMNGTFRAEIVDTGIGIAPDVLPRLFDAFEQGEDCIARRFGGLGLGLSIVKSIIELHGGRVMAKSDGVGKGARFAIEMNNIMPLARPATPPAISDTVVETKSPHRILLVEDHDDTRRVLARLLSSFGFIVAAAGTVREALDLSERERFDVLVSDIGLPDGTGTELMRELKLRQTITGIALSGFGRDEDLRRSADAGFTSHLIKPVNFQTLRDVILRVAV